jgi:hypothetical protein
MGDLGGKNSLNEYEEDEYEENEYNEDRYEGNEHDEDDPWIPG